MSGEVMTPDQWYQKKLQINSQLKYSSEISYLKNFIDFLKSNGLFMSMIDENRDTVNSSIYIIGIAEKDNWICDIKFFDGNNFADNIQVVCKEQMNAVGEVFQNEKFKKIIEILTDSNVTNGKNGQAKIKEQITIEGFEKGLKCVTKALKIYKIFN